MKKKIEVLNFIEDITFMPEEVERQERIQKLYDAQYEMDVEQKLGLCDGYLYDSCRIHCLDGMLSYSMYAI